MVKHGCTPLHMWIRSMEYLFNLAIKLQKEGKKTASFTCEDSQLAKQRLKVSFFSIIVEVGM
jgi:hypothetical protein